MHVLGGALAVITIDVDPMIELGPVTLTWHGLTIAIGIGLGTLVAGRYARARGLDPDILYTLVLLLVLAGMAGARLVYLAENDASALLRPGDWLGGRGFSFYGGMIFGTLGAGLLLWRRGLEARYLDALAYGFPLGMAVGRIGDLINGEHYGGPTDLPWGIRYANPAADVPSPDIAYHPGGLYEIVLAVLVGVVVYGLRDHLRKPASVLWTVIGLYAAGRFAMFFYRVDSEPFALGLDTSQWISLLLVAVAFTGLFSGSLLAASRRVRWPWLRSSG